MKLDVLRNRKTRAAEGSIAFELALGALVTMSVMAGVLNLCFAVMAFTNNDHACRDAARAAAGRGIARGQEAARAAVNGFNSRVGSVSQVELLAVQFESPRVEGELPLVKVSTRSIVTLPVPIDLFGTTLPVQRTYIYPVVQQ